MSTATTLTTTQEQDDVCSAVKRGETETDRSLCVLQQLAPQSTEQERIRFLNAKSGDIAIASKNLLKYMEWRKEHITETTCSTDEMDWQGASAAALQSTGSSTGLLLPRIIQSVEYDGSYKTDIDGNRVLCLRPGLIDDKVAPVSVYSLALALYIDKKLSRTSYEKLCLVVDVRAGQGWRNLNAVQLVPFMKTTVSLLSDMFPERLNRAIVFPVPRTLSWIWTMVQKVLDGRTAEKFSILSGPALVNSPPPMDALCAFFEKEIVIQTEDSRVALFQKVETTETTTYSIW